MAENLQTPPTKEHAVPGFTKLLSHFNEGILIVSLTGIGYMTAFSFERSYLDYFDIPADFVSVSLESCLRCIALFASLLVLGVMFIKGIFDIAGPIDTQSRGGRVFTSILKLLGMGVLSHIATDSGWLWIFYITLSLVLVALYFTPKWKGWMWLRSQDPPEQVDVLEVFRLYLGPGYTTLVLIALLSGAIAGGLGNRTARLTSIFYEVDGDSKEVLVTKSGEMYIVKKYDAVGNAFEPGFALRPVSEKISFTPLYVKHSTVRRIHRDDPVKDWFLKHWIWIKSRVTPAADPVVSPVHAPSKDPQVLPPPVVPLLPKSDAIPGVSSGL